MLEVVEKEIFIENDILLDGTKIGEVELNPKEKSISRFFIYEPFQNKGYGTQVLKTLINKGYDNLWVLSDNEKAIHIYKKCGFHKSENTMYKMMRDK